MRTKGDFQYAIRGFSLIELLITVTALSILLGIAIPAYNKFISQKRIRVGVEELYSFIKIAQSTSLNKQTNIYLSMKTGGNWCYGLSDTTACDCSVVNSCRVNSVETVVNNSSHSGQALTLAVTGLSGTSSNPYILFQGSRGTVETAGTASFSLSGFSATVNTNTTGLASICSSTVSGYPSC